ncbi:hypothetical protein C5167_049442 [Papaver somniferum]|uniref:Replication protein A subunit n=1 Tax=Papaver somniferum TaxID=3469 RepID=A0A4Y7KP75_PAPSO|nr:replication protein A 70 kDa DNA-binding subunit A-like [Papaver somniferum]RZC73961.1 hypothetical protein C5167_049442 [Papaver somniferum]
MAINLTQNAIAMICSGQFQGDDLKPIVQVVDIKLISSNNTNAERYRMVISDGVHTQQGMLATQKNELVHSGQLKTNSIVELSQFVGQLVQNRKIIIIIDLKVIVEKCEKIGNPYQYGQAPGGPTTQSRTPMDQPWITTGDHQSYSGASLSGGTSAGQNLNGRAPLHQPRSDSGPQTYGNSISINSNSGGCGPTIGHPGYPKPEPGFSLSGSVPFAGNYGDQNRNINSSKMEGRAQGSFNNSSRPLQPTHQQPPSMYTNRGPVAKNEALARIIPIRALNPYLSRWTIRARVTSKKELRHYTNARGEGKVFSFDLLDSEGGEIQVTGFNAVADLFYDQIEAGKVYLISRGSLKPASKNFNRLQNEYEITLENTSTIQPCTEDDHTIPKQQFNFRRISDIETMEINSMLDIIGVVSSINPTQNITTKNGETQKKTLQLKDMSGRSVELTLWGSICSAEGQELQKMREKGGFPVLAVKAGRVNQFNGRSVGTLSTSQLFIEPDVPEARTLKQWFDSEGRNMQAISLSKESSGTGRLDVRKTLSQIKYEQLGTSEKPDWITVQARISFVKTEIFCYTACPELVGDRQCSKKVINDGDGRWKCERCDKSFSECDYRYILQLQIQDFTGHTWVTAFQETGEKIMGHPAKALYYLKHEEQDEEKFSDITRGVLLNRYIFKLKVKQESFEDQQRVKSTIVAVEKLNFSTESRHLLDLIDRHLVEDANGVPGTANSSETGMISKGYQDMGNMGQLTTPSIGSSRSNASTGKDLRALPANQMGHHVNRYNSAINPGTVGLNSGIPSTGVHISCSSCGGGGHDSNNCPSVMNRQGQSIEEGYGSRAQPAVGGSGNCYKCGQSGHFTRDCPSVNTVGARGGGNNVGGRGAADECYKCHQSGHWAKDCPGTSSSSTYGSSGVAERYRGVSNQRVGGF